MTFRSGILIFSSLFVWGSSIFLGISIARIFRWGSSLFSEVSSIFSGLSFIFRSRIALKMSAFLFSVGAPSRETRSSTIRGLTLIPAIFSFFFLFLVQHLGLSFLRLDFP